ncbi:unnamed protein product [Dracunculus medinensis]|uniref:Histone domain-containing protein n=1 Tax=Dracunculus medinensis TaxID=318479 RepID=A0A0N4UE73_DRAME|nr:unnamed protein product [Dracunculus medinensis]
MTRTKHLPIRRDLLLPSSHQSPKKYQGGNFCGPPASKKKSTKSPQKEVRISSKRANFRKGCRALQEVKHYQRTTHLLISKSPFTRLIKEILNPEWSSQMYNITPDAISALQEASEAFLVQLFENSYLLSLHAKRITLMVRDICMVRRILNF